MIPNLKHYRFIQDLQQQGGEIYLVGGSVRDHLLEKPLKDLDIVVRKIPIKELLPLLKKTGIFSQVGKSFGVIKFTPHENRELEIDIALPRTETSTGSGHKDFDVQSDPNLDLALDLKRRDFTMNAMAVNILTGKLVDPFDGQRDIRHKTIRTVFVNSFVEDPLRLLRAVQFAARFDFEIAPETFGELQTNASLIKTVSAERVIIEIKKLFEAPFPSCGFNIMRRSGLLPLVFPDVHQMIGVLQPKKENEDVYDHTMRVLDAMRSSPDIEKAGNPTLLFAALFHDAGKPKTRRENPQTGHVSFYNHNVVSAGIAGRWLKQFKASTIGIDTHLVCHLIKNHMFETKHFLNNEKSLRRFINKVGVEPIFDLLDLRLADKMGGRFPKKLFGILSLRDKVREEINKAPPFTPKDLAINGHDIMTLGYQPGPIFGEIQRFLMDKVLDDPELNTKEILLRLITDNKDQLLQLLQ